MTHRLRRRRILSNALTLGLVAAGVAAMPAAAQARPLPRIYLAQVAAAWGDNEYGNLGDGTLVQRPTFVNVGNNVTQVAAGYDHSLAVISDGSVWSWGRNTFGQLGTGAVGLSKSPQLVSGISGTVTQVAAGWSHSLALGSDGTVWAWGDNQYGELGDGNFSQSDSPVKLAGLSGITQIAAGEDWSLALRSDGTVWAWGDNLYNELGPQVQDVYDNSDVPVQVTGLSGVTQIAAGAEFGMAIQTTVKLGFLRHSVWTWGQEVWGQVGNGQLTDPFSPGGVINPYQVTGIPAPAAIAAGTYSAMMVGTDGSVWGWGQDLFGNLGAGSGNGILYSPTQTLSPGSGIIQLAAGYDDVLGLRSDGTVVAWGNNSNGQLGNGTTTNSVTPVQVSGLSGVSRVSAGFDYSLAVHTTKAGLLPAPGNARPASNRF
jgi:Regulator of chromosome condensation (RCC1) repeat